MSTDIDRQTARRRARDIVADLRDRHSLQAATDAMVEIEEICGLHRTRRKAGPPSDETLLCVGGVAREFADQAWRISRPRVVDSLGHELADILAPAFRQTDADEDGDLRATLLGDLWALVELDLDRARNVFPKYLAETFRDATTEPERRQIEQSFRDKLAEYPDDEDVQSPKAVAGHWMLEYVGDDLSAEEYETVCRETGQTVRVIERKLDAGHLDEALEWAARATEKRVADLCWTFYDRDRLADLVEADIPPDPSRARIPVDELYDTTLMLVDAGEGEAALPWIREALRVVPRLEDALVEIRETAEEAGCFDARLEEALLEEAREHFPEVVFSYHLEFDEIGRAFDLWERIDSWSRRDRRRAGDRLIEAARANDALDVVLAVATANADSRIDQRGRDNYADACEYLEVARDVVDAGEVPVDWDSVIAEYDDRLDRLPAFRDEARKADLLS